MPAKLLTLPDLSLTRTGIVVRALAHDEQTPTAHPAVAVPHRHDHYSCFLATAGTADIAIDLQPLSLTVPALLVSCPGQLHRVGASRGFRGWILLADAKLVGPGLSRRLEQATAQPRLLALTPATCAWFEHLLGLLRTTTDPAAAPLAGVETSHHLLAALLTQAAHLLEAPHPPGAPTGRPLALTLAFRHLLRQHFRAWKQPAAYARALHVSVGHLNDTVKATTGFSVSYFIQQQLLAEAQRLLGSSDQSVQQIAAHLGYADAKYFSRFFAKGTGLAPGRFRQVAGQLAS